MAAQRLLRASTALLGTSQRASILRRPMCRHFSSKEPRIIGGMRVPDYDHNPNSFYHLENYRNTQDPIYSFGDTTGRIVVLNRPKQLNALNLPMIRYLTPRLQAWVDHAETVGSITVMGSGDKAFCAGGDVVALANACKAGGYTKSFFREEYQMNYLISTLQTPYIAFIDGVTMGGGVGLSVHGKYRLASPDTLFAMPETAIGFFPDVGGSYFLPRLQGQLGMYLALTGARLKGADVFLAGIATHMYDRTQFRLLLNRLHELPVSVAAVETAVHCGRATDQPSPDQFTLLPYLETIDKCFGQNSVEDIIIALEKEGTDFAKKSVATMKKMSPTSLKVTFRELREGAKMTIEECFLMEYRIAQGFMRPESDFYEGVRALLIDGDKQPKWKITSLDRVTDQVVQSYFQPVEDDLRMGYLAEDAHQQPKQVQQRAKMQELIAEQQEKMRLQKLQRNEQKAQQQLQKLLK